MTRSRQWARTRLTALIAVLLLHAGFLFIGLRLPPAEERTPLPVQVEPSLQVVLIPPTAYPQLKLQVAIARPFGGNASITVEPPHLDGNAITASPGPEAAVTGSRDGVDWAAEARREMQAMEIRRNRNPGINTVSMRLGEDYWIQHAKHFPGDRLKTESGDWLVWLSDDCYQIATAAPTQATTDMIVHRSICRDPAQTQAQ